MWSVPFVAKLAFNTFPHFTNQQMFGSLRMGKKYFKYLREIVKKLCIALQTTFSLVLLRCFTQRRFDWRVWFPPVTNTMQTTMALSGLQLPVYFLASARILSNVSVIYWHCFQIHGFTNVKGLHTSTYIFYLVLMDGTFSLRD